MEETEKLEERIKELEEEVGELEEEVEDLKSEIGDLQHSLDSAQDDLDEAQLRIDSLEHLERINIDYLVDSQKLELLAEHWEHITLSDIESILKIKSRI